MKGGKENSSEERTGQLYDVLWYTTVQSRGCGPRASGCLENFPSFSSAKLNSTEITGLYNSTDLLQARTKSFVILQEMHIGAFKAAAEPVYVCPLNSFHHVSKMILEVK